MHLRRGEFIVIVKSGMPCRRTTNGDIKLPVNTPVVKEKVIQIYPVKGTLVE